MELESKCKVMWGVYSELSVESSQGMSDYSLQTTSECWC